MLSLNLC